MESINSLLGQLQLQLRGLAEQHAPGPLVVAAGALAVGALVVFAAPWKWKAPPSLLDPIPFVFNTIQFVFYNERFMIRVTRALRNARLVRFYLFSTPVFLVSGQQNIQTIFARSHKVGNEALFVRNVFPNLYDMPKEDVRRFAEDKSGRGRLPAPGTEHISPQHRYWFGYEHVHSEHLSRTQHLRPMAEYFRKRMSRMLDERYAAGEWTTVSLIDFCKRQVAERSIEALFGPRLFALNPGLLDAFWDFDSNIFALTLAFPKWLHPGPYRAQERYYAMMRKYVDAAWANFDWNGPAADADWEPHFGARVCRELVKWLRESGFHDKVVVGAMAMLVFALNSNSIPITMWVILEIAQDPSLLQAVREEVATAYVTDPETGSRTVDVEKVVTLPLLQSILTETLRLRMNFNLMRNVNEHITMDGFTLRKGSMLQAPMLVAHHDEAAWGSVGHPASEFWAERHIKYKEERDEAGNVTQKRVFAMAGRPSSYFPFGGGQQICPGRHLAKLEILTTIALLVGKFDIEPVGWTKLDGSPSNRPAQSDQRHSGAGAMPPDRDLNIRWKRIG